MKITDFFKKHIVFIQATVLLVILYSMGIALRGIWAPWEYERAVAIHSHFPWSSSFDIKYLRVPAALCSFITALLIFFAAYILKIKYKWSAVVFYLLFPPVYYFGTAITFVPFISLCALAALLMLILAFSRKTVIARFVFMLLALPPVCLLAFFAKTPFFNMLSVAAALSPVVVLGISVLVNVLERKGKANAFLDMFSKILCRILLTAAILVIVPALLRYKWFWAECFALFKAGESTARPVLALLLPLLWIHLSRGIADVEKKLAFIGVGIGFILFSLPMILPWHYEKKVVPEHFLNTLPGDCFKNAVIFADDYWVSVLECRKVGNLIGLEEKLKDSKDIEFQNQKYADKDIVLICSTPEKAKCLSKYMPPVAGKRISSGDNSVARYFRREKK